MTSGEGTPWTLDGFESDPGSNGALRRSFDPGLSAVTTPWSDGCRSRILRKLNDGVLNGRMVVDTRRKSNFLEPEQQDIGKLGPFNRPKLRQLVCY